MLDFYRIKRSQGQKVFFWSDLHLCHEKDFILNPRNFENAKHAKEEIGNRWLKKITNNDIVYLLGDSIVGAGNDGEKELTNFLHSVPFKEVYLMPGNHVSGFSQLLRVAMEQEYNFSQDSILRFGFTKDKIINFIPNYFEISLGGQLIVMSHYPLLSWNKSNKGAFHLFGHCHSNLEKKKWIKDNYLIGKVLDVGLESCPFPMEFLEIQEYMQNQKQISVDQHIV